MVQQKLIPIYYLRHHIVPGTASGPPPSAKKSASAALTPNPSAVANSATADVSGHVNVICLYCKAFFLLFNHIYIYYEQYS